MARFLLWIGGLGFLVFGAWALAEPTGMWRAFGLPLTDLPAVRTEIRAFYGGLGLGLGALLAMHAAGARDQRSGLLLMGVVYGALACARLVGLLLDGAPTATHLSAFAIEAVLALAAAAALRSGGGSR